VVSLSTYFENLAKSKGTFTPAPVSLLQQRAVGPRDVGHLPPSVQEVLRSTGKALDAPVRGFMESRLSRDFSGVRVHTDSTADKSAGELNALAYSVGQDIAFGSGRYAPHTVEGGWLLAHELAHVAQQSDRSVNLETLSLDPISSRAETEATDAANAVATGQQVRSISAGSASSTVRRSVLGSIGGALAGGAIGAGLGFLAGGPIGAIVGGVLGGVTGLIAGETATANKRPLTPEENIEAKTVFGSSMDWGKVRMAESAVMAIGGYARTPFNTAYFPTGFLSQPLDKRMPLMIHEMTHIWQTQHGISVAEKLFWALHGAGAYNYGDEKGLRDALAQGKKFTDFNTEQQGDICMDYYVKKKAGMDVSAYQPFIDQLQGGSRPLGDFPLPVGSRAVV
jgi:hypothetical protein